MSRINAGVSVQYLTDEHLKAEHREIKRICHQYSLGNNNNLPKQFTLGTGHLRFFLNKGLFTLKRFSDIDNECRKRGFNMTDFRSNWKVFKPQHMNDWQPSRKDNIIIINRITQNLRSSSDIPHYYSKVLTVNEAIDLIRKAI